MIPTIPHQDDVIKNPNRNKNNTPISYIPEYKRLKVIPILQDFPSLDGDVVESPVLESSAIESHILDNNEHISYGFAPDVPSRSSKNKELPDIGEFVLMVCGKVIAHGGHEYILSEAKSILYREHPKFINEQIQMNDIIILKRIGLKIGVFLDE